MVPPPPFSIDLPDEEGNGKTLDLGEDKKQYRNWYKDGTVDPDLGPENSPAIFRVKFEQAASRASRINFDIRGVDPVKAFRQGDTIRLPRSLTSRDPAFEGYGFTAWELRTIMMNKRYFAKTTFYRNGRLLTPEELQAWHQSLRDAGFTVPSP